ncbi:MAG: GNAT family N-acetyltransferase [Opitutales bacterium]|nr:GNAT family N-acetyltransferase [Opitutales bacterium]
MMTPPAPDWRAILRPGSHLYLGGGAACPLALVEAMLREEKRFSDLELLHGRILGPTPWTEARYRDNLRVNAFYPSGPDTNVPEGTFDDYTPAHTSDIPALFAEEITRVNVVLLMVSPPDEYGYCSLGPSVDLTPAAMRAARLVVAQINPKCPRTSAFIHVSRLHYAIEAETDLPTLPVPDISAEFEKIGGYCAQLINDGDTVQLGTGPEAIATARALRDHRQLGIHSETFGDALLDLFRCGVVDNSRKSLLPGRAIASTALGSGELYSFLDRNPHIDLRPSEFTSNPITIARNENMVAVGSALRVDLSGQVVIDSLHGHARRGLGSQVDFARGAGMSRGGRAIVAMPSTGVDGEGTRYSRIVAELPAGSGVGLNRADVYYIVTEHGVASLRGRTVQERVLELIQVAHPEFRAELLESARAHHLVPVYVQLPPPHEEAAESIQIRKIRLRDESDYILRPLNPSDDRRLQEFFYSHTEETIIRRYGFTVTRMSRERAFELVGVDQNRDLALAVIELHGPRQIIHAVGRYYLDRDGKSAEMAFVVSEQKRRLGMTRHLLERMIEIASSRGLKSLWAQVDRSNTPMLALFRKFEIREKPGEDAGSIRVELPLKAKSTGKDGKSAARSFLGFTGLKKKP